MSREVFLRFPASFWFIAFVVSTCVCFYLGTVVYWDGLQLIGGNCVRRHGTLLLNAPNASAADHASFPPKIIGSSSGGGDVAAGAAFDRDQEALGDALARIKVGPNHICAAFAGALSQQGVTSLHDLLNVAEADARDMLARAGMSKLQQHKVMQAAARSNQTEANTSVPCPCPSTGQALPSVPPPPPSTEQASPSVPPPPPSTQQASLTVHDSFGSSGNFPRMGHEEWKHFVSNQLHLTRNFSAAMYSRWTWYNYRSEWIKDDWKSYTPRAAEWDHCMVGRQYCVASYGMYAYSADKLEYYTQRALLLRDAMDVFYPGWRMRIYYDEATVPQRNVDLMSDAGIDMVLCGKSQGDVTGTIAGMFWRFYVGNDPNVDRYIVRDLDSNFIWREKAAVDEWILSEKPFHLLRDHHEHGTAILGGMWGGTKGKIPFSIKERAVAAQHQAAGKGGDQYFLTDHVWPIFQQAG
jgi:hypothetical protein